MLPLALTCGRSCWHGKIGCSHSIVTALSFGSDAKHGKRFPYNAARHVALIRSIYGSQHPVAHVFKRWIRRDVKQPVNGYINQAVEAEPHGGFERLFDSVHDGRVQLPVQVDLPQCPQIVIGAVAQIVAVLSRANASSRVGRIFGNHINVIQNQGHCITVAFANSPAHGRGETSNNTSAQAVRCFMDDTSVWVRVCVCVCVCVCEVRE